MGGDQRSIFCWINVCRLRFYIEQRVVGTEGLVCLVCGRKLENHFYKQMPRGFWGHLIGSERTFIMSEVVAVEGSDSVINAFLNHSYRNLNSCGLTLVSTNQHYQANT